MNIVFLDFDGVLNSQSSAFLAMLDVKASDSPFNIASPNPVCVALFDHMIRICDAHIVVSSSWRQGRTVEELRDVLRDEFKMASFDRVIGKTRINDLGDIRGDQVDDWLMCHREKVDNFVILDDDTDFHDHHEANFVNTNREVGFSSVDFEKVCNIFQKDWNLANTNL